MSLMSKKERKAARAKAEQEKAEQERVNGPADENDALTPGPAAEGDGDEGLADEEVGAGDIGLADEEIEEPKSIKPPKSDTPPATENKPSTSEVKSDERPGQFRLRNRQYWGVLLHFAFGRFKSDSAGYLKITSSQAAEIGKFYPLDKK